MSYINIRINTDNDAFQDKREVTRILKDVTLIFQNEDIDNVSFGFTVNDINGNKACEVRVKK